jgi:hypothetical protein
MHVVMDSRHLATNRRIAGIVAACAVLGCSSPVEAPHGPMHPQSIVLLVTPKMLPDFDKPDSAIAQFFDNYKALTSRASEVIVIFAVGNSDHILEYRGSAHWSDRIEWARTTDMIPVSDRVLDYDQLFRIVNAFRSSASAAGINLKVYDQIDSSGEFTISNNFKYQVHQECTVNRWQMFDVRARLQADKNSYATRPTGIPDGITCGEFLADQVSQYMRDVDFDGILYGNQLGTRGRWFPGDGPGYSAEEAAGIDAFLSYSRRAYGSKGLIWFDSYNDVKEEHDTFSFPADGYHYFDYLLASGFCVITTSQLYVDDLESKLSIVGGPRVLATLDYVDPWYTYNSMTDFPVESAKLEDIAIHYRYQIDGVMFFANDEKGAFVPRHLVDAFATRFFGSN